MATFISIWKNIGKVTLMENYRAKCWKTFKPEAAIRKDSTKRKIPTILRCGRRLHPAILWGGIHLGGMDFRAGTWSVQPWAQSISGISLIFTAADSTCSFRIMRQRLPNAKARTAMIRWSTGFTTIWLPSTGRRWASRPVILLTWSSCLPGIMRSLKRRLTRWRFDSWCFNLTTGVRSTFPTKPWLLRRKDFKNWCQP